MKSAAILDVNIVNIGQLEKCGWSTIGQLEYCSLWIGKWLFQPKNFANAADFGQIYSAWPKLKFPSTLTTSATAKRFLLPSSSLMFEG